MIEIPRPINKDDDDDNDNDKVKLCFCLSRVTTLLAISESDFRYAVVRLGRHVALFLLLLSLPAEHTGISIITLRICVIWTSRRK